MRNKDTIVVIDCSAFIRL